jgi:hypothetical protein
MIFFSLNLEMYGNSKGIVFEVTFSKELFKYYFIKKVILDDLEKVILVYSTVLRLSVSCSAYLFADSWLETN